jgi:hypothetical protein
VISCNVPGDGVECAKLEKTVNIQQRRVLE